MLTQLGGRFRSTLGGARLTPLVEVCLVVLAQVLCASATMAEPPSTSPIDLTNEQWQFFNSGQTGGAVDADIDAPEAWYISTGDPATVIAIIDSGIDTDHPDLVDNIWVNPGDPPGGGDDDNNGFVDDVHGWHFIDAASDDSNIEDGEGHGTRMAGVAAADTVQNVGIAGTCWDCRMMVLSVEGYHPDAVARAIVYAVDEGADIISMSFGCRVNPSECPVPPSQIHAAMRYADLENVVLLASTGNDDSDELFYPAAWPEAIGIGASTHDDSRFVTFFGGSNYGSYLDLLAPGKDLPTTGLNGSYTDSTGTSPATALASGVVGLVISNSTTLLSPKDVRSILNEAADFDVEPLADSDVNGSSYYIGSGRLNAFKALTAVNFLDLHPGHWSSKYVRYALQECLIEQDGFGDGTFRPDQAVTRAETLKISYKSAGLNQFPSCNAVNPFLDLNESDWFACYAKDAFQKGYVEGTPCSCSTELCWPDPQSTGRCFFGNNAVTRAESAKLSSLAFGYDPENPTDFINVCPGDITTFPDVPENHWARDHIHWMANAKLRNGPHPNRIPVDSTILSGYPDTGGLFKPDETINRAEIIKIVAATKLYFDSDSDTQGCGAIRSGKEGSTFEGTSIGRLFEHDPSSSSTGSFPDPFVCPGGGFVTTSGELPLNGDAFDGNGDPLYYFWTADGGSFSTSDPVNFKDVIWTPPPVSEDTLFIIGAVNGDRKGFVGRSQCKVLVPATVNNSPPSGNITSPNGTQTGTVTVGASASDTDGLERVTATFVSGGTELVLCGSGASPCSGTSGSFIESGIDPASYGATAGNTTLRLFVEDSSGDTQQVDSHSFNYDPPTNGGGFTLTLTKQGTGDGTVSGSGINCGPGCASTSVQVPEGDLVTLTGSGTDFVTFAGDLCFGNPSCTFTMYRDTDVRATFSPPDTFQAISSIPGDGDTGASAQDNVRVIFNREILLGPNQGSIVFEECGGSAVSFAAAVQSSERRLVLNGVLAEGTCYNVAIPSGAVTDDQGSPLPASYGFSFTTGTLGDPEILIGAFPVKVMEGDETRVSVWFDRAQPFDRTITLTSSPPGQLTHPSQIVVSAGDLLSEFQVDTLRDNSSVSDTSATLTASESASGQASIPIEIKNENDTIGSVFRFLAGSMVSDDNGNGVFEAGEDATFRLEARNNSGSTITNAVITVEVLTVATSSDLRVLDDCDMSGISPSSNDDCEFDLRADDDLVGGEYVLRLTGSSSSGGFVDHLPIVLVNNSLPNYHMDRLVGATVTKDPGEVFLPQFVVDNRGSGFDLELPLVRASIDIDGSIVVLGETYSDIRDTRSNEQILTFTLATPNQPGSYVVTAEIDPDALIPETTTTDNTATFVLNVRGPNHAPVLAPIGGPFFLNVGETLSITAEATDANDDPITYSLGPGAPAGMSIGSSTGVLTWTPGCGEDGSYAAEVIATDNEDASDSEVVTINVGISGDLQVQLTPSTSLALPGGNLDWTMVVTNIGPSCLTSADVANVFPGNLTNVSWTCSASAGATCTGSGTGDIQDTVDLLSGSSATYAISTDIVVSAVGIVEDTGNAAVAGGETDPNPNNNSASATVTLRDLDYGDAPNSALGGSWSFLTQVVENGPRHGVDPTMYLGNSLDGEADGQPTLSADGDDLAGTDDDDGVVLQGELIPCGTAQVEITASTIGFVDAWVDFNTDGDWDEAGEQIFVAEGVVAGLNSLSFSVPCDATPASLAFARFRYGSSGGLAQGGLAEDGEVEDYGFLIAQVFHDLTVTKDGPGAGLVTASPNGIQCGADCSESYPVDSVVVLSASEEFGSAFGGWTGGGCAGTGTCVVTMDQARSVNATFNLAEFPLTVTLAGDGVGSVTSDVGSINCGATCSDNYVYQTAVTLTPSPDASSAFTGWSGGGCSGTAPCTVTVDQAVNVTATFELLEYDLNIEFIGDGSGTVNVMPSGTDCTTNCSVTVLTGSSVTLTADSETGSSFTEWGGACTGTSTCVFTITAPSTVSVTFELSSYDLSVTRAGSGDGTVTSSPAGIDCGDDCSESYLYDETVTLAADPVTGAKFSGWTGGGCSGVGNCQITISGAETVEALFDPTCFDDLESGNFHWSALAGPNNLPGSSPWGLTNGSAHSGAESWLVEPEESVKDQLLVLSLPAVPIGPTAAKLRFWHLFDTEAGFDGGVLEYSSDGGTTWFDILDGDGNSIPENPSRFLSTGYNALLGTCCMNPLADREAWSGDSSGWQETIVDLNDFAGHSVRFRWRFGNDDANRQGIGWLLDDIVILDSESCPFVLLFGDGFESGNTSRWSNTQP